MNTNLLPGGKKCPSTMAIRFSAVCEGCQGGTTFRIPGDDSSSVEADGAKVGMLQAMGFPEERARAALRRTGNDVQMAADLLMQEVDGSAAPTHGGGGGGTGGGGGGGDGGGDGGGAY